MRCANSRPKLKDKALFGIAGSEKPELDGADLSC